MAALALSFGVGVPAWGQGESAPEPREAVGTVAIPAVQGEVGERVFGLAGRVLGWCGLGDGGEQEAGWAELAGALGSGGRVGPDTAGDSEADRGWSIVLADGGGLGLEARGAVGTPVEQTVAFDVALDCNTFRRASPQPFSRSAAGRVLDSLTIDNARRARLTGIFADPDDLSVMTLVLFTESRAEAPGRWQALRVGTAALAAQRGEPEVVRPIELDLRELWSGLLFSAADCVLGTDPACEGISMEERLEAWGLQRVLSLRALGSGLDGRVWVWPGAGDGDLVWSLPLARGATDRRVADALRGVFGQRLVWGRDDAGRATATLALVRENRAARAGDRTLSLRFITIAERTTLTVATEAGDLDSAVEILAAIPQ